jgi:hypothetical protein
MSGRDSNSRTVHGRGFEIKGSRQLALPVAGQHLLEPPVILQQPHASSVKPRFQALQGFEKSDLNICPCSHANGSDGLFAALGRKRVVLGFPSAAGSIEKGVDVYVDVAEQPTIIEKTAPDVAAILRTAGFRVQLVS